MGIRTTDYYIDEKQKIAYFSPPLTEWKKKLNGFERFYSSMYPYAGLYYHGQISLNRFLTSMAFTLNRFPMMFGRMQQTTEDTFIGFSGIQNIEGSYTIQLEIAEEQGSVDSAELADILPRHIDDRIRTGIIESFDRLQTGVFKLTTFKDGFAIGYYTNHAFFDQSSITYFFKFLAHVYSMGGSSSNLPKPFLVDVSEFKPQNTSVFNDLSSLRAYGETLGMRYVANKNAFYEILTTPYPGKVLTINFNPKALSVIIDQAKEYISANDIIQAVLLKIYAFDSSLSDNEDIYFAFPVNMKKHCGYSEEAIGNVITSCQMFLKINYIRESNLVELALRVRSCLRKINSETLKESLAWYENLSLFGENPQGYLPIAFFEPRYFGASNWATFDYDSLCFDEYRPFELRSPSLPTLGLSIICFSEEESQRVFSTSVAVPHDVVLKVYELSSCTQIFVIRPE